MQVVEQLVGERVARVGLVERDRRDAVGDLVAQGVVGHGAHPTGCSGSRKHYCLLCQPASPASPAHEETLLAWPPPQTS